jgi:hypothetical protein
LQGAAPHRWTAVLRGGGGRRRDPAMASWTQALPCVRWSWVTSPARVVPLARASALVCPVGLDQTVFKKAAQIESDACCASWSGPGGWIGVSTGERLAPWSRTRPV